MTCREQMKEFLVNLLFLIGLLSCRLLLFIGMTSICIGVSAMISQSYVYFNRVKLSTSFQTFITIGCLILFSFCGSPCTSAATRRRIRQHPFMLFAIPHLIYISIYFYSFMELFYLFIQVHSLPLGITNDAMYIIDDRTTKKPRGIHSYNRQYRFADIETQRTALNRIENSMSNATTEELITKKNWDTAFFLLNFVYIIHVTCRVVLIDLEKNIPDEPSGSIKQIAGFLIMIITQFLMLFVYLLFIAFASMAWVAFCLDPRQCLLITMMFAILIGITAGFVESGKPWPKKRENNVADPFGWFENLLRARFTILVSLFALVNWSFFQDRRGPKLELSEPTFMIYIVVVTASVVHVTKMFSIIAIKRAEKIISAYRLIVAEDIEGQQNPDARNNVNAIPENLALPAATAPPAQCPNIPGNYDLSSAFGSSSWETIDEWTGTEDSNPNRQNREVESINNNTVIAHISASCSVLPEK